MSDTVAVSPTSAVFGARAIELPDPIFGRSERVTQLVQDITNGAGPAARLVDNLCANLTTPLVEPGPQPGTQTVTFLYRDTDACEVLITINRITHQYSHSRMEQVAGTDLWFRSFVLADDWRGSYAFLPLTPEHNRAVLELEARYAMHEIRSKGLLDPLNDPVNPMRVSGRMSVTALDNAPSDSVLIAANPPAGTVTEQLATDNRRVWVYEPPVQSNSTAELPCLILLDGEDWQAEGFVPTIVENLAQAGRIARTPLVVMLDAEGKRRMKDLSINGDASDYVAGPLLDWIRERYNVSAHASDIIIAGQSLGGLTSLKALCDHPQRIANAISLSASLWQDSLIKRSEGLAAHPINAYIAAGKHEPTIVEPNRDLVHTWTSRDITHKHSEYNGGHDMACWRIELAHGLNYLM